MRKTGPLCEILTSSVHTFTLPQHTWGQSWRNSVPRRLEQRKRKKEKPCTNKRDLKNKKDSVWFAGVGRTNGLDLLYEFWNGCTLFPCPFTAPLHCFLFLVSSVYGLSGVRTFLGFCSCVCVCGTVRAMEENEMSCVVCKQASLSRDNPYACLRSCSYLAGTVFLVEATTPIRHFLCLYMY